MKRIKKPSLKESEYSRDIINAGVWIPVFGDYPIEFKILGKQFEKEIGNSDQEYNIEEFYKWYNSLEENRKLWVNNLERGKDEFRNIYLHPTIRKKVESIEKEK
jgi:hypothetical protein